MQKITPHLWFDTEAEEAVQFYTSVFNNGKVLSTARYTEAGFEIHGMKAGTVMTMEFEIEGYRLIALNGGPVFTFTPAVSFMVNCPTTEEVDELWKKLSEGNSKALMDLNAYPFSKKYGWIQDKYGLSWQIMHTDTVSKREIVPSLMFTEAKAGKAEEAMNFYVSLFENSKIGAVAHYGNDNPPNKEGMIMYADFFLAGQKFAVMDSAYAHGFTFNEAISFLVTCENQEEIDRFWNKLSAVPESEQCGWLKDTYGVSWQIVPAGMTEMMNDPNKEKVNRAVNAFMQMKKFDIAKLEAAFEGK